MRGKKNLHAWEKEHLCVKFFIQCKSNILQCETNKLGRNQILFGVKQIHSVEIKFLLGIKMNSRCKMNFYSVEMRYFTVEMRYVTVEMRKIKKFGRNQMC